MKVLTWLVYIILMMAFVLGSLGLCRKVIKKHKVNRWIIGFSAPLVLIIPKILFDNINPIVWTILVAIFIVLYLLFFEINREISESKGIKATMDIRKTR